MNDGLYPLPNHKYIYFSSDNPRVRHLLAIEKAAQWVSTWHRLGQEYLMNERDSNFPNVWREEYKVVEAKINKAIERLTKVLKEDK